MHDSPRRSLAVGFFDGVHLGHRAILSGAGAALTFRTHPLAVLAPGRMPKLLMDCESRLEAIRATGVEEVVALDFTPEFAQMSAEEFASRHLAGRGTVRCGSNWRFGAGGTGDADFLKARGFDVEVVPSVESGGSTVSSTRIRAALAEGRLDEAVRMLGHPWSLCGRVVPGKGEGHALGFPTVNVTPIEEPPLARGVYAVSVGGVPALANWGVAPTYCERAWRRPVLEIHFPGTDSSRASALFGSAAADGDARFKVQFTRFLRPERKFSDRAALRAAISRDIASVDWTRDGTFAARDGAGAGLRQTHSDGPRPDIHF